MSWFCSLQALAEQELGGTVLGTGHWQICRPGRNR